MKDTARFFCGVTELIQQPPKGIGPLEANQAAKFPDIRVRFQSENSFACVEARRGESMTHRSRLLAAGAILRHRVLLLRLRDCDLELNTDLRHALAQ